MNYYDAKQVQSGPCKGKWHYVSQNRREGTHPVGYCSRVRPCPDGCRFEGERSCNACGGKAYIEVSQQDFEAHAHDTADEARGCFRRYLLDGSREESYGDWTGCVYKDCDVPTKKGMTQRPPLGNGFALCDKHRTQEILEELTGPIGQIAASY